MHVPRIRPADNQDGTPGDHLEKPLALGILKQSGKWHIRVVGSKDKVALGDPMAGQEGGDDGSGDLPYALVMENVNDGTYQNVFADHTHQVTAPPPPLSEAARVTLNK